MKKGSPNITVKLIIFFLYYGCIKSTEPAQPEPEEEVVYKESEEEEEEEEEEERSEQVDREEDEQSDKEEEVDWAALEESAGEYSSQSDGEDDEKESCNTIRCCETSWAAIKGGGLGIFLIENQHVYFITATQIPGYFLYIPIYFKN